MLTHVSSSINREMQSILSHIFFKHGLPKTCSKSSVLRYLLLECRSWLVHGFYRVLHMPSFLELHSSKMLIDTFTINYRKLSYPMQTSYDKRTNIYNLFENFFVRRKKLKNNSRQIESISHFCREIIK